MTVAFASGALADLPVSEALALISEAGFEAVELTEGHARDLVAGTGQDRGSMNVVAVSFGDTDCGDRNVVQARLDLVDAVGAPLATVRAVTSAGGAAESWRTAAEAARDGLFAADGRMALDVPAGGTLIPDLATYAQFWPMTIRGRAPLAINLAAATSAGFNPNQVWRTLASRVSLLRLAETFIGAIELVPWARMAAAYAYPGAWVVSPDHAPTLSDMQEFRLELTGRLASISLPSRV